MEQATLGWETMTMYFVLGLPIIHARFLEGQHAAWLIHDVGSVLAVSLCVVTLGYAVVLASRAGWSTERMHMGLTLTLLGVTTVALSAMGSRFGREKIHRQWRIHFNT